MTNLTQFNLKKIDFMKRLKTNFNKSLLISKGSFYNKYFLFKIKRSNVYRKYLKRLYGTKKTFKKVYKSQLFNKQSTRFVHKKLFRNKSYKNLRSNLFSFQNIYHRHKIKTINIF